MEELREELYRCIELYGMSHSRTIAKSHEMDKLIQEDMEVSR